METIDSIEIGVQPFYLPFNRPIENGQFEVFVACIIVCITQKDEYSPIIGSLNYQILGRNYDQDTSFELIQKYCNGLFKDAESYMLANCDELGCY